jgi:hypothetical protein
MSDSTTEALARIRAITARAALAARGEAIPPDPHPTPSQLSDRLAAGEPERGSAFNADPPRRHWSDVEGEDEDEDGAS